MNRKILIITTSYDVTIDYFIEKFKKKANFFRFNVDDLSEYKISFQKMNVKISYKNWVLDFKELISIYYRKPAMPNLKEYSPEYHKLMAKDILTFLHGIVESFEGRCLSKPLILKKSENKIYQLYLAKKLGFKIPEYLVTTDEKNAMIFLEKSENIIKPLSIGKFYYENSVSLIYTNLINKDFIVKDIDLSPSYFQRFIDKDYELRVTVVNKKFFIAKIDTTNKIDWRMEKQDNIDYQIYELPERIKMKCLVLLEQLNLNFGAFDFLVKDGEFYFLEVNPNGQWLWLEEKLGLKISDEIFRYLIRG